MPKLAILVVHGMGDQYPDFGYQFIRKIIRATGLTPDAEHGGSAYSRMRGSSTCGNIVWNTGYWADLIKPQEEKLYEDMRIPGQFDVGWFRQKTNDRLRKFVLTAFADAVAYRESYKKDTPQNSVSAKSNYHSVYTGIHERIYEDIVKLHGLIPEGDRDSYQLVIFAHSLGGYIISNCLYDLHHISVRSDGQASANDKIKEVTTHAKDASKIIKQLRRVITFGCNIPLFSLAYNPYTPVPLPEINSDAKWHNFFDPDDVLGYPLEPIFYEQVGNERMKCEWIKDEAIEVGRTLCGKLRGHTPFSHEMYWEDPGFIGRVGTLLKTLL